MLDSYLSTAGVVLPFLLKGFWETLKISFLSLIHICASTYAEVGKKMLPKATLKEFSGGSAPVGQALSTGRLDAGIMSLSTANQFLVDFGNLRVLDGVMVREPLAFAVGPNAFRLKFWLDNWQTLKTADNTLPEQIKYCLLYTSRCV